MLAVAVKRYHWFPSGTEPPMAMATCYHSPASLSLSRFLSTGFCPRHRPLPPSLSPSFSRVLPPHDNAGRTFSSTTISSGTCLPSGKRRGGGGVNRRLFPQFARKERVSPRRSLSELYFVEEPRTFFFLDRLFRLSFLFSLRMVTKSS